MKRGLSKVVFFNSKTTPVAPTISTSQDMLHSNKSVEELFALYTDESEPDIRAAIAFQNPRLLSKSVLLALQSKLQTQENGSSREIDCLGELDACRVHLARNPDAYPLGKGPIERLYKRYSDGEISIVDAIREAGLPEISGALSVVYVHAVSWQAFGMGQTPEWRQALVLCRLLAESALAGDESLPVGSEVRDTITGFAHLTILAFTRGVDDALYSETVRLVGRLIARAERIGDADLLGSLIHALGSLHSDHYTIPIVFEPQMAQVPLTEWLVRPKSVVSVFQGLASEELYPAPTESLKKAVDLYLQALPLRVGLQKGLTYKAIAQTLWFLSEQLGQPIDEGHLKNVTLQAHTLLSKHPDPKHMLTINQIISSRKYPILDYNSIADRSVGALLDQLAENKWTNSVPEDVIESHGRAVADLRRAATYGLRFVLYLRNFSQANEKHQLAPPFSLDSPQSVMIVDPQVTYSVVDHKLLSLFPEGVVGTSDPAVSLFSRQTLIPMLSLPQKDWKAVVSRLMSLAPRVVVLLDEITPGVLFEIEELIHLGLTDRTFILTGQAYRTGQPLPALITSGAFRYVGDWLDMSYDEAYHDYNCKAHAIVQQFLPRFLTPSFRETASLVNAWLSS
jgi:hypothetical protein